MIQLQRLAARLGNCRELHTRPRCSRCHVPGHNARNCMLSPDSECGALEARVQTLRAMTAILWADIQAIDAARGHEADEPI